MTQQWNDWAAKSFVDPWPNKVDGGVIKGRLEGGKAPGKGKHGKGKRKRAAQAAAGA